MKILSQKIILLFLCLSLLNCQAEWQKNGFADEKTYEKAMQDGFTNAADYQSFLDGGFDNKEQWSQAKVGEFNTKKDFKTAQIYGINNKKDWDAAVADSKEKGFVTLDFYFKAKQLGIESAEEWAKYYLAEIEKESAALVMKGTIDFANYYVQNDKCYNVTRYLLTKLTDQKLLDKMSYMGSIFKLKNQKDIKSIENEKNKDLKNAFYEAKDKALKGWQNEVNSMSGDANKLVTYFENNCSQKMLGICAVETYKKDKNIVKYCKLASR